MAFKIIIISIVYVQCRQHPPNRRFPPPSCLGCSLPLSWQRYATPSIGWIESWLTSRRTFSKRRTKRQRKPSTVCGTTSHTIIKRRHTRSKHASTRRWRKASKRLMTPSLPSRTRRRSSTPETLWEKVRGFWPIGKSLYKLPIGWTTDGGRRRVHGGRARRGQRQ